MRLVKVTLKNGKVIRVLPREVPGLKDAGLLKEEKGKTKTKEEKETGSTKEDAGTKADEEQEGAGPDSQTEEGSDNDEPAKDEQAAMERMKPKSKRPPNITSANISQGH